MRQRSGSACAAEEPKAILRRNHTWEASPQIGQRGKVRGVSKIDKEKKGEECRPEAGYSPESPQVILTSKKTEISRPQSPATSSLGSLSAARTRRERGSGPTLVQFGQSRFKREKMAVGILSVPRDSKTRCDRMREKTWWRNLR